MQKIKKIFINRIAEDNFKEHVSQAKPIIRMVIKVGLFLLSKIGKDMGRIPLLKLLYRQTKSLIQIHNLAAKNGLDLLSVNEKINNRGEQKCSFDDSEGYVRDLIIIGSGPGGAITARNANLRNLDFLIIEKGTTSDKSILSHSVEQMSRHFRHGGQELMISWPLITFAQGESWGGGSSVNSGLYHEIPDKVKKTWARDTCLPEEEFDSAQIDVVTSINVEKQSPETLGIYGGSPILGMKKFLGWDGGVIPRWRKYLNSDEYVHFGMSETYLNQIREENKVLGHEVDSMRIERDGVEINVKGSNCYHKIAARSVCLSAGTLATPEILVRSKLAKPSDFYFQFHAMVKEIGKFPYDVNNLKDIDPHQIWSKDLSFKIGAAVGTPELLSAIMETKGVENESSFSKICSLYISLPSIGLNGLIKHGRSLTPYFYPDRAMRKSLRLAQATLRKSIEAVGGKVLGNNSLSVSTVHIFGSIPLGKSRLVDNRGFLIGSEKKIFIRDASLLPSHPLVNPQGPLMQFLTVLDGHPGI
jgi:choline dehydrogenase-like flavoprotein